VRRKLNTLISVLVILLFIAIFKVLYATNVPEVLEVHDNVVYTIKNTTSLNVVSFQVKTDKPSYSRGEAIQIQFYISVKNVDEKSITLGSYSVGCIFYDSTKRELFTIGSFVTLIPRTVLPQTEFGIRDIRRWNTGDMAPGIYTIKVIFSSLVGATAEIEVEIS